MIVYNYKIVYIGFEFKEEPFNNSEFVTSPWYTHIDYINIYILEREIETWVTDRRIPKEKKSNYDVLLIVSLDALVVVSLSVKDLNHLWLCPPCSRGTSSIFPRQFCEFGTFLWWVLLGISNYTSNHFDMTNFSRVIDSHWYFACSACNKWVQVIKTPKLTHISSHATKMVHFWKDTTNQRFSSIEH